VNQLPIRALRLCADVIGGVEENRYCLGIDPITGSSRSSTRSLDAVGHPMALTMYAAIVGARPGRHGS